MCKRLGAFLLLLGRGYPHNVEVAVFSFTQEIHTFQIDFSRHVNNAVYIQWLEIARSKICEAAGYPLSEMEKSGYLPILTDTEIQYKRALYLGDSATIEVWISEMGGASAWMSYRVLNQDGEICATARQRGLWIDSESLKPKRFSPQMREDFLKFLLTMSETV